MTAQQSGDVKVLFLAGKGRSGGTLLASLLGQIPGFFNIGELNRLWDWGLVSNFRCGCGLPVQECPTWHAILEEADRLLEGHRGSRRSPSARHRSRAGRRRPLAADDRSCSARDPDARPEWNELDRYIDRVVGGVPQHRQGHRRPRRGRLVATADRAGRARPRSGRRRPRRAGDPRSARGRVLVEALEAHHRSRQRRAHAEVQRVVLHHQLAGAQPRGRGDPPPRPGRSRAVRRLGARSRRPCCASSRRSSASPPATSSSSRRRSATLAPTHSVGGNPVRMTSGAITIEPDDEWQHGIEPRDRAVATAIALPLLHRYGLPVRSSARPAPRATRRGPRSAFPRSRRSRRTPGCGSTRSARVCTPRSRARCSRWAPAKADSARGSPVTTPTRASSSTIAPGRRRKRASPRIGHGKIYAQLADVTDRDFDLVVRVRGARAHRRRRPGAARLARLPAARRLAAHQRARTPGRLRRGRRARRPLPALRARHAAQPVGEGRIRSRAPRQLRRRPRSRAPTCPQRPRAAVLAQRGEEGDTPEERIVGSGRLFQPGQVATALACATVAAPARLAQAPFAGSDLGTGYVVLARRSG